MLPASPVHGVKRPSQETARDRVLTDAEIRSLWHACDAVGGPAAACIKVMLLTGQRRGECAGMRRSEIDGNIWSLPPERVKNNRRHDVPLSRQVLEIIEAMPQIGDPVFTTDGDKPITNFALAITLHDGRIVEDIQHRASVRLKVVGPRAPQ